MGRSQPVRWMVLLGALVISTAILDWPRRSRRAAATVEIVEARRELNDLLGERVVALPIGNQPSASYPPQLVRQPLDEQTARRFFPAIGRRDILYDPLRYFRHSPDTERRQDFPEHPDGGWLVRTNSLGLREDQEPSATKPRLRILVVGASNAEGLCANAESAANVLEAALRRRSGDATVEALNAGIGGSCFYNYLATLEHYRSLDPDAFVVIAYGTDFCNSLPLERYFLHRGPWQRATKSLEPLKQSESSFVRQLAGTELGQVVHMLAEPDDIQRAVDIACTITAAIEEICRADGLRLVCVYLPPPLEGQPELLAAERAEALALLGLTDVDLAVSGRIAAGWLAFLGERAIEHVDLRPTWRSATERLYWHSDTHVNLAGQRAIAAALLPLFDEP